MFGESLPEDNYFDLEEDDLEGETDRNLPPKHPKIKKMKDYY